MARLRAWPLGLALALALSSTAGACLHPSAAPRVVHAGAAAEEALPREFSLLCWNVHKQRHDGFAAELERFAASVDLLALQEAVDEDRAWPLGNGERSWTLVVAFEIGRERVAAGVATGSRVEPSRERPELSPRPEPLTRTPKSMLASWIAVAGSDAPLLLVNLHGVNFRPAPVLAEQLRVLDPLLEAQRGPVLVVGDFNTWSRARRAAVDEFVARHELRPAFVGDEAPRLDAVYLRGLIVREAEVLATRRSDHDALRVRLAVPSAG